MCALAYGRDVAGEGDNAGIDQEGTEIYLAGLQRYKLVYVATPYQKYPEGRREAFFKACEVTAALVREGVVAFSPIAHSHPLAAYGVLEAQYYGHEFWMGFDRTFMDLADALVVAMLPSWEFSRGIDEEVKHFVEAGKPVYYLNPDTLALGDAPAV